MIEIIEEKKFNHRSVFENIYNNFMVFQTSNMQFIIVI